MGRRPLSWIQLLLIVLGVVAALTIGPLGESPGVSSKAAAAPQALAAVATPVTFDITFRQGLDGYSGCLDTRISQENPTRNFAEDDLFLGMRGRVATLIRFDLSSIRTDAIVQQATLGLYVWGYGNRPAEASINAAYVVNRPWNEAEATWQRATAASLWTVQGCAGVPTDRSNVPLDPQALYQREQWYTWDVTGAVQGWVGDPGNNRGVLLQQTNTSVGGEYFIASSEDLESGIRPYLRVQYALPTPTPTPTLTPTRTSTPTITPTPTITLTPTPRIRYTYLPLILKVFPRTCVDAAPLLSETFESPLLPGWSADMEEGQRRVWDNTLDLWTTPYTDRFPVLWRNDSFVALGSDWVVEVRFRFSNISAHGTTIALNSIAYDGERVPEELGLPPGWEDILSIHHVVDPIRSIYRYDALLLGGQVQWVGTPGDTSWHHALLTLEGGQHYTLFVDGRRIGSADSSLMPRSLYIGNPRTAPGAGAWTELHVADLQVANCLRWGSF
jgi:hypothetical protein